MLDKISTLGPDHLDKESVKEENRELIKSIAEHQRVLYAEGKRSLLIILQGIDASGKDGTIRRIFSGINPLGCNVFSFKKPTEIETSQDFLWRIHQCTPADGMIHIFNRSHYEDILVPLVEGGAKAKDIDCRYDQINHFEELLQASGTTILKFYLHISKDVQLERLHERLSNPKKYWKHNDGDWDSRKKWDDYMACYETIFKRCNNIPWHIVPADRNWVKINSIAKVILKELEDMKLEWPPLETERFG